MPVTHKEGDRYPLRPPNLFPMSNLGEGSGLLIREAWFESTMGSQFYPSVAQPGSASGLGPEGRDRKSTRLNSSHIPLSRMPSSA